MFRVWGLGLGGLGFRDMTLSDLGFCLYFLGYSSANQLLAMAGLGSF